MIVCQHVSIRRDHKAASGANFNVIEIRNLPEPQFFDFGVDAAHQPDEHGRILWRRSTFSNGDTWVYEHKRHQRDDEFHGGQGSYSLSTR
jgi:hypothetical protein